MRIISPQSATLTNIEVLSFLTANPPRRPPNAPPGVNQKHWIPSPDLRDHNTVVKEIHNYATRLSPHLLRYPAYTSRTESTSKGKKTTSEATPIDHALRELITRLQPYGLTKGEVLMIVNLGIGVPSAPAGTEGENGVEEMQGQGGDEDEQMEVDEHEQTGGAGVEDGHGHGEEVAGEAIDDTEGAGGTDAEGQEGEEGEGEEGEAGDYGALALIDTVIEEREQRLSDENVLEILSIIRETLGAAAM
ncbi:uncharacterized protein BDV17DRAFT_257153 [Aspergillus undulatus]|uniref:uncharacterized protein n=1 Tax=Aspergillus undulatus TaxID=1810928 RepID=UPI003CCDFDE3